jgi:hypothetical protein
MRLSDLLHSRVIDADGTDIGSVDDVRMVQDGPMLLPFGAAFRVEGLMVGHRSVGTRLGYVRGGLRGPWLLRIIFTALERRARYVDWEDVVEWDGTTVRVAKRRTELKSLDA